eukprot:1367571-Amphidinium_carterae.1
MLQQNVDAAMSTETDASEVSSPQAEDEDEEGVSPMVVLETPLNRFALMRQRVTVVGNSRHPGDVRHGMGRALAANNSESLGTFSDTLGG